MPYTKSLSLPVACFLLLAHIMTTAQAQNAPSSASSATAIEEIVITGSRRAVGTAADTLAPVDIIAGEDFSRQAGGDLSNLLRTVVPSYNVSSQPISDAATLVRPANLRGLAPDQTLVLLNGKRRHRAAVISFLGNGVSDGSQGPDVAIIPALALKQVEVLRDGAAAQYGADAIAGVMNFVLKDDAEGGSLEVKYGSTYEGDGEQVQVAGNIGLPLSDKGFINATAEWRQADPTNRSVQRDDARQLIEDGNTDVRQPFAQIWGAPEVKDDIKTVVNMGFDLSEDTELYAFANYAQRMTTGGFYFRNPNTRSGVFSNDNGVTRLVGDLTPEDGMTCPGGINFNPGEATTGQIVDPIMIGSMQEAAQVALINADDNCFIFNERFPGGFTPQFGGDLEDIAGAIGYRGTLAWGGGLDFDLSFHAGRNEADFFISNTINASLGPETPTTFELGSYIQTETNVNADFSWPFEVGLHSPLNVAFGFEWREEQFEATAGQEESYQANILAELIDIDTDGDGIDDTSVSQGFGVGANGFNGFSQEEVAGRWDRSNIALYVDLEADITADWALGAALRWEDFSDFGTTTNFKLTSRYKITDVLRLRGSVGSGFRAPTPGQQNVVNVTTAFRTLPDGSTGLSNRGTIPPTNPVAMEFGGEPLGPEESDTFTIGMAADLGPVLLTVDYFNIKVTDRITQSANVELDTLSEADRTALVDRVALAADLQEFRFYVNDFDTRTQGLDVVASLPLELTDTGATLLSVVGNYTRTKVIDFNPETLDDCRIRQLQDALPRSRFNATLTHDTDKLSLLGRINYHGSYFEAHNDSCGLPIDAGAEVTVDAELTYRFTEQFALSVGAENLFNNEPHPNPHASSASGAKFPESSPFGLNGGYYYARGQYTF